MISKRLYQLDIFRFIAAISVVLYHYTFRGFNGDYLSKVEYLPLEFITKYGYLGVNLFFMISGFVITMSTQNNNVFHFLKSRFIRLYPAYWFCLILTTLVTFFFDWRNQITNTQFFWNFTMLHEYFSINSIQGVFWTLFIELKFYCIIAIIISFSLLRKNIVVLMELWTLFSVFNIFPYYHKFSYTGLLADYAILDHSCYFIAGYCFYSLYTKSINRYRAYLMIFICFIISQWHTLKGITHLVNNYKTNFNSFVIIFSISFFYLIFFLLIHQKLNFLNNSKFAKIGVLTYPLYLIHENIGYIILNNTTYINKYFVLICLIILMIASSYLIHIFIEKKASNFLKNTI